MSLQGEKPLHDRVDELEKRLTEAQAEISRLAKPEDRSGPAAPACLPEPKSANSPSSSLEELANRGLDEPPTSQPLWIVTFWMFLAGLIGFAGGDLNADIRRLPGPGATLAMMAIVLAVVAAAVTVYFAVF